MTKKLKENNEPTQTKQEQEEQKIKAILKLHDFIPKWKLEEECFKKAVVYDFATKKISEDGWPRFKPVAQIVYENWLMKVVNSRTGDFYPKKNREMWRCVRCAEDMHRDHEENKSKNNIFKESSP
ncbi:MAG TPA: hypothetical protein VH481_02400 [Nitrososphaeraceae archaeon]|jgi:hypothetical protein